MLMVACFDRAKNVHGGDIRAGEGAIVHDLLDAAPVAAICAARSARPPGRSLITAVNRPSRAVRDKAAFDHAAENVRIDVSAAKQKNDAFSGELC